MRSTRLTTDRLELARWTLDDVPELRRVLDANQEHLAPWIPFMRHEPRTLEQTRAWVAEFDARFESGEACRYAVRERASSALVGEVMVMSRAGPGALEGGYWFAREAGGRGLATEAMGALVDAAFAENDITHIEFLCDARNAASTALARRLGATHEEDRTLGDGTRLQVWVKRR